MEYVRTLQCIVYSARESIYVALNVFKRAFFADIYTFPAKIIVDLVCNMACYDMLSRIILGNTENNNNK